MNGSIGVDKAMEIIAYEMEYIKNYVEKCYKRPPTDLVSGLLLYYEIICL